MEIHAESIARHCRSHACPSADHVRLLSESRDPDSRCDGQVRAFLPVLFVSGTYIHGSGPESMNTLNWVDGMTLYATSKDLAIF